MNHIDLSGVLEVELNDADGDFSDEGDTGPAIYYNTDTNEINEEHEFIIKALEVLCPNGFGYNGHEIHTNSDPVPTQAELDAQVSIIKTEYATQAYARNRASASGYPSIPDQLDEIYHNGIDSWKAVIKVTKDKYPKDNT